MEWLKEQKLNDPMALQKVGMIKAIADDLDISITKLSLAWCLKNPNVSTVILGASKVEQLKENLTALDALPLLTDKVMENIEAVLQNKP
jgi:aryl-alcohol dehydrogenase-like predicted oxidoreductase